MFEVHDQVALGLFHRDAKRGVATRQLLHRDLSLLTTVLTQSLSRLFASLVSAPVGLGVGVECAHAAESLPIRKLHTDGICQCLLARGEVLYENKMLPSQLDLVTNDTRNNAIHLLCDNVLMSPKCPRRKKVTRHASSARFSQA